MRRQSLTLFTLLAIAIAHCQAWDDSGHLLVDEIAARNLCPEVIKKMEPLLKLLDTQFNEGIPYNILTAGLWLDDQRGLGKANKWSRWHYIDVPCDGDTFKEPPPPHALWALDQAVTILSSKTPVTKERAEALAQIMHIIADIHQPLHTATRDDLGGNAVNIAPLLKEDAGPKNLHAFWDAAYRYDTAGGEVVVLWKNPVHFERPHSINDPDDITSVKALALIAIYPQPPVFAPASKQPWHDWARETHALACKKGWPKDALGQTIGVVHLTPEFIHESHTIAEKQIVKAGYRLAALLNDLFGDQERELSGTQEGRK